MGREELTMLRHRAAIVGVLLVCAHLHAKETTISTIRNNLFLGQVYPSGNVYIVSFDEDRQTWPEEIRFLTLGPSGTDGSAPHGAALSEVIEPDTEAAGFRAVEVGDSSCLKAEDDFFCLILGNRVSERVARYTSDQKTGKSFNIIGHSSPLRLANIDDSTAGKPLPLTELEAQRVNDRKKEAAELTEEGLCATVRPSFLDSAEIRIVFDFTGTGFRGRLAGYRARHCFGYVDFVHVLHILKAGDVAERLEFVHHVGAQ
jgi:hypothetical protein